MLSKFSFCFAVLLVSFQLKAQSVLPDSLQLKYSKYEIDTSFIDQLNQDATSYLTVNPHLTRIIAEHAMATASQIKYTRGYGCALNILGNTYWQEGVYEFAQNYYLLAARQYQTINDSIGLGHSYNNIGEVFKKLKDYNKAIEYLLKAKDLMKSDPYTLCITLYNIGELYIYMGKPNDGRKFIDQSLSIAKKYNNKRAIAYNYWSLGALSRIEGKTQEAVSHYLDAEKILQDLGEIRSLIQTYQDIARIYRDDRNYPEAENYLMKSVALGSRLKVADLQVHNYLLLSQLDSIRGNYKNALRYMSRYNALKDSVYNLQKTEQIARLQTIYETEVRERENRELKAEQSFKNSQLKIQQITLAAISGGLLLAGVLAWFLHRQRKKIIIQKEAIEIQAAALLRLNEELQNLNKNLEVRIDERTAQLTHQNQQLTEYTFINAHKLRAPVASILGLINLLQQVSPQEKESILNHLKTCGEQLDKTIREVSRNLENAIVKESL